MAKFDEEGRLKVYVDGVVLSASIAGGGVGGPTTSTDNAVARWDGINGNSIKNSAAILSDAGVLTLVGITASADVHVSGVLSASVGGDLNGNLPNPKVIAFTSGATQISFDNILNGEVLLRTGNAIASVSTSSFLTPLATSTPVAVSRSNGAPGVSIEAARSDHKHDVFTQAAVALTPDLANSEGTAASLARSDHVHNVPTATPNTLQVGGTNTQGAAASFARSDHVHKVTIPTFEASNTNSLSTTSTSPVDIPDMTITPGAGTYIVIFSCEGDYSNNSNSITIQIAVDGVGIPHTVRTTNIRPNRTISLSTQAKVTLTAGQTVTVQANGSSGNPITISERSIILIKTDE